MLKLTMPAQFGLLAAALAFPMAGFGATLATASITATPDGANYDYVITLNNTGTTPIEEFWFAWVPGGFFLTSAPTNVVAPAGWTVTEPTSGGNYSIQWVSATGLAAGSSLSGFDFTSSESPAALQLPVVSGSFDDPATTAFVYPGMGTSAQRGVGEQINVNVTPEPSSLILSLTGACGIAAFSLRKRLA